MIKIFIVSSGEQFIVDSRENAEIMQKEALEQNILVWIIDVKPYEETIN